MVTKLKGSTCDNIKSKFVFSAFSFGSTVLDFWSDTNSKS